MTFDDYVNIYVIKNDDFIFESIISMEICYLYSISGDNKYLDYNLKDIVRIYT